MTSSLFSKTLLLTPFIQNRDNIQISKWNILSKKFLFFLFLHKKSAISLDSYRKDEWSAVDKLLSRMTGNVPFIFGRSDFSCLLLPFSHRLHLCLSSVFAFFFHLFVGQPEFFHQGFSPCVRASFLAAH